jgi:hypothetical protein
VKVEPHAFVPLSPASISEPECISDELLIDGNWGEAVVDGATLTWASCSVTLLDLAGPTCFTTTINAKEFTAELRSDGTLLWSDGDIWRRHDADGITGFAQDPKQVEEEASLGDAPMM